jgi:hypothetical protein
MNFERKPDSFHMEMAIGCALRLRGRTLMRRVNEGAGRTES